MLDVAVIGGGPAGSTAATLLARAGRQVAVFEKERFPRFHIGESLLPRSLPTLARLGVLEKIESGAFVRKFGAGISSGCGKRDVRFYFKDGFRSRGDHAFQVERAGFDKILLDHAAQSGAHVHEQTSVSEVALDKDCVRLKTTKGHFEARYLLDCSGRNALVGSQLRMKRPYADLNKFAVFAHYEDVPRPDGIDGTLTRMVRTPDTWFWLIPLSPTKMSVGVVMDTETFRSRKSSPESVLEAEIAATPPLRDQLSGCRRCTPVHTSGDYSYCNERLHGERWLLAGDAAGFIDPIFSSGVFLAILGAEQAADSISAALIDPKSAPTRFARYERQMRSIMRIYLDFVRAWYRQEFVETVLSPRNILDIVPAVNAVLAGNVDHSIALSWRLALFRTIVKIQRYIPLCPRLALHSA